MADVEIVNEPPPAPRATGKGRMDVTVRLIDPKTGEQISSASSRMAENERRTREERKY